MRSQTTKPLPKKGALSKSVKTRPIVKQAKKKIVSPKKGKSLVNKPLTKTKKSKDGANTSKEQSESSSEKSETSDISKAGTSKTNSKNDPFTKKNKKDIKEKKISAKISNAVPKNVSLKKSLKLPTKSNIVKKNEDIIIKYKLNSDAPKKSPVKLSALVKTKPKNKVSTVTKNKKAENLIKQDSFITEVTFTEDLKKTSQSRQTSEEEAVQDNTKKEDSLHQKYVENIIEDSKTPNPDVSSINVTPNPIETPKSEVERPPKFFTSSRSPRMMDIDIKCLKNSKGTLSVSERFLSMKCEPKVDNKNTSNNLISQGPDIDVYTFTEKVDSPKSILSDFRSPTNKNIGRVRPIARVKGTVVDKRTEIEKKKYSPHRPIEEVVKQLKANKRSEELKSTNDQDNEPSVVYNSFIEDKEMENAPRPIVSKSYKMVARKSSVTGKPFSPIKFFDQVSDISKLDKTINSTGAAKKTLCKPKKCTKKFSLSDDEIDNSKFSLGKNNLHYTSSDDSISESNDDIDTKESSGSDASKNKKYKNKKYKKIMDSAKKTTTKELKELSKDSLIDLKDEKPSKRRLKLLSMWSGPKKHRMASLNAIAKVHCLYENESRTHMELGLMRTIEKQILPGTSKSSAAKKKDLKSKELVKQDTTSESEYENKKDFKEESSESSDEILPQRILRGVPGIRSAGKYWDPKSSTSSSEDSEIDCKKKVSPDKKKSIPKTSAKSDTENPTAKTKKTSGVPVKKKRNRNEIVMDLKDMVVQKRMASLNATAILAASYEKRSPKSSKDDTTSDSCSDESFTQKSKNGVGSGIKSETKTEDIPKREEEDTNSEDKKQKVEVIVNQDTDVTITGVYSTHHHEGFCTVSGMQYRISSTSHTQTTATTNCEKEECSREDGSKYTPLSALSSMQPPAEHSHPHSHPVGELGGLGRRAGGCSSAFSAPSPAAHHDPGNTRLNNCILSDKNSMSPYGYYQPAGPLIKESAGDAERALARYHPSPHYHPPHPPVLQQYGPPPPYYPPDLCYSRYYRMPAPYHPPQPDAQMVGVGNDPYPPQYYATPPCYQHSPQRIPYVDFRGCPCPLNACPKNVLIGPVTGKAPTGGGPADMTSALAPPGASFRPKVRACTLDLSSDTAHGSGKDPPLADVEPPAGADAPHPCPLPTIGGASPKRELYEVRDTVRLSEMREAAGPPSPARGSAGACAPQPPPAAPRRARFGKDMARRSLAGDDTSLLLAHPLRVPAPPDADDDVVAISPPVCAPIDLSSSDERSTPLVDVKKENEGPTYSSPRKTDAQALKEHNCPAALSESETTGPAKASKRRYSRPKLEIDMIDAHLEEECKTNGIGEHVKLQKRRKVSSDQTDVTRPENITKEIKKRNKTKRRSKSPIPDKKSFKRKLDNESQATKTLLSQVDSEDPRLKNIAAVLEEPAAKKHKSALLLDNLLRKNSIDRAEDKGLGTESEINPAELFLPTIDKNVYNSTNKTLNNNILEKSVPLIGVRANTIAAVTQLIGKKLAKNNIPKVEKIDSKIIHNSQTVLKSSTFSKEEEKQKSGFEPCVESDLDITCEFMDNKLNNVIKSELRDKSNDILLNVGDTDVLRKAIKSPKVKQKVKKHEIVKIMVPPKAIEESHNLNQNNAIDELKQSTKVDGVEKTEPSLEDAEKQLKKVKCKLAEKINNEAKGKTEKVAKLLVSKKPALKTDEARLVVEEACLGSAASTGQRRRRSGGSGGGKRRRAPAPPALPRAPLAAAHPRWSNGWSWEGEHYVSKVYLNNDARMDLTARCWARMRHRGGDAVARGDCVLLRASPARAMPFVARVASLWENPDDGEMMVSLVWYYRPEHTELGPQAGDAPDEVFASRHRDANSVACIEDKCYVLTYNEYCRYRKRLKAVEEGITIPPSIVPVMPASEIHPAVATNDSKIPPSVSSELVLFCRKIYDFRSKKIQVPNK